jgi:mRNA interferase MazF
MVEPVRGMIIQVNLNPTKGSEKRGIRPAIVVTDDKINANPRLPLVQIVPITRWQEHKKHIPFMVELIPDDTNNLDKQSFADCMQTRIIDYREGNAEEFGFVSTDKMEEIDTALRRVFSL